MDRLRADRIVVSDTLEFEPYDGGIRLRGRVRTERGGVLDVRKSLRPVGRIDEADPRGRTVAYRYQAVWQPRAGASVRVLRYDNYGEDISTLHDADGSETARYPVPHDRLPYMDEVIREREELARLWTEAA